MKAFNMVYSQARQPSRAMGKKVVVLATCMAFAACTAEGPVPTSVQHDPSQNQRYTDGRVEPNVPLGDGCAAYIQKHYAHPPLMAIGDSLYNGVQSMRINWWLSEWSAPTLVAIRTHLIDEKAADRTGKRDFFDPQYPGQGDAPGTPMKDYGFNLEAVTIGNALSAPSTQHAMLAALDSYMPPNNRPVVDNLAFSGAMSDDLIDWTGKDYETNAQALLPILKKADLVGSGFDILASTFFNVNARFVLNPTHNACIDTLSALDQVRLRTPRRLLVNIGANDGLWRIAFLGSSVDMQSCPIPSSNVPNTNTNGKGVPECQGSSIAETAGPVYLRNMQRIITSLAADEGIGWIYINGMPRPSQTANMVPEQDGSWSVDLFHRPGLTADKMAAADKLIVDTNTALSDMIQKANNAAKPGFPHFAYVDLATELDD